MLKWIKKMKLWKKIILSLLLLFLIACTVIAVWQRNNIKAVIQTVSYTQEEIAEKLDETKKTFEEEAKNKYPIIVRDFTAEEERQIMKGELSVEEAIARLTEEYNSAVENYRQEKNSSELPSSETDADVDTLNGGGNVSGATNTDNKATTSKSGSGVSSNSKSDTKTGSSKTSKSNTSTKNNEEVTDSKSGNSKNTSKSSTASKNNKTVTDSKSSSTNTSKSGTTAKTNTKEPSSSTNVSTSGNKKPNTNSGTANSGSTSSGSTSGSQAGGSADINEIVGDQIIELYSIKAYYLGQLGQLEASVKHDYAALPAEQRNSSGKQALANQYIGQANSLLGQCDSQVASLVSKLKSDLQAHGADTSIIQTIMSTYENEKALKKAYYIELLGS